MLFRVGTKTDRNSVAVYSITAHGEVIEGVNGFKHFAVVISSDLSWHAQVTYMMLQKASRRNVCINNVARAVVNEAYACSVWHACLFKTPNPETAHCFLLYVNDMSNVSKILHFILLAGDTNIFLSDHNVERLKATANTELNKLSSWFLANCLTVNVYQNAIVFYFTVKELNIIFQCHLLH